MPSAVPRESDLKLALAPRQFRKLALLYGTVYVRCALAAKYFRAQFLALFFALGCKPTRSFADLFALLFVYLIVHFYRSPKATACSLALNGNERASLATAVTVTVTRVKVRVQ